MDESERTENEPSGERGPEPTSEPADNANPGPTAGPSDSAGAPPPQFGDQDGGRRRRRGRRGRGGGGGGFAGPRPPYAGPRPQFGGPRPQLGAPPFRPQAFPPREESEQARELAGYERRQAQRQRGPMGWRGGAGGPGPAPQGGGWRQRRGGEQRYSEAIRRVTAGPHKAAPSHEPVGEPIAGPHAILEAIRAGRNIRRLYVSQDRNVRTGPVNELIAEAQQRRIFVRYTDKMEIARLSPVENHQGVVAIVEGKAGVELDELLLHLDTLSTPALVLVVDSLQDPQNFGVLLRSAEGAGVDGVVIPHHRAVGLTPAVTKTSAGASEHLLIADVANLRQAIDALKEKGIWVVATDETGDLLYDEVDYRGPTAIIIGGEGEGIRRLVLEGADQVVRLPMEGMVSSLNAAAAGTVMLYEALRQRRRDVAPAQTRTPRPEEPAEAPENGGWEDEPQQTVHERSEPVEAPERETDETDQVAPAAEIETPPADEPTVAEKPKRKAPAKRRSTKKSAEEKSKEADDASS
ncbi:MAG: 23S rRNA (guanosine(2251)-2'-O)-methyltransferase RlmB [Chloroflexi bacterium]|nr:MAG: 23S rRNA (guanosine(2251)-2'-O)-methyltransferase RlmB [Chloroflexota bacterium]